MLFIKRLLRYGKSMVLLNRTRHQAVSAYELTASFHQSFRELFELLQQFDRELQNAKTEIEGLRKDVSAFERSLNAQSSAAAGSQRSYDQRLSAISGALDMLARPTPGLSVRSDIGGATDIGNATNSDERSPRLRLLLENFYVALEAKFRGSTQDIGQRQSIYLPDVKTAIESTDSKVVLDLGCGRGEWLALLRRQGIEGLGIDSNEAQLADARSNGLAVSNADGLSFLREQKEGSFSAITAFHIFEHLPFSNLADWILEIRRVLAPGGILIAETPNPENLIVGANTFHLDPTHVRPLPSGVLSILCETSGLAVREVRPLHPHEGLSEALKALPEQTAYLLYGYQDYGLIAERPRRETY